MMLDGRVVLLTGGARGIGRAIAGALLSEGARVAICGRTLDDAALGDLFPDAHDRLFGAGTGEAFFTGPYLDVLPATVNRLIDRTSE